MPYKVTFIIPDDELHAFLRDVPGNRTAESINRVRPTKANREGCYNEGKHHKGISGEELLIQILESEPYKAWHSEEIAARFVEHGFAPQSVSSYLSRCRAAGKIESLGQQFYCIKKEAA